MTPSFFGAELLHELDVAKLRGLGVVGVEQVHRIEPAGRPVIVREHLEPVVHAAQHELSVTGLTSNATIFDHAVALGFSGVPRPSLGDYVMGLGATRAASAAGSS
jgi:hypothetical protein